MTARPGLTMSYKKTPQACCGAHSGMSGVSLLCYLATELSWTHGSIGRIFDNDCSEKRTFLMIKKNYIQTLYKLYKTINVYKFLSGFRQIAQKIRNTCTNRLWKYVSLIRFKYSTCFFTALERFISYIIVNFG